MAQTLKGQPANLYADTHLFEVFEKLLTALVREVGAQLHAASPAIDADKYARW